MTKGKMAKILRIRVLVTVSSVALVLVFFLAPIIPVEYYYSCFGHGSPYAGYTDWQSPSYYLYKIGTHYTPPYLLCL